MSTDMPDSATTAIYLQNACLSHKYIRNSDVSTVVERPERIRAVKLGLAAAIARLEEIITPTMHEIDVKSVQSAPLQSLDDFSGDLVVALEQMKLSSSRPQSASSNTPVKVVNSLASTRLLDNAAIKYIHGDIDGDVYLENLVSWAKSSEQKVAEEASEIPEGYSQGDLFLCPGSIDAIQGALGTVCEAVDDVMIAETRRAFVAIRPPGHHCGEDTPSGFCFVNNVAVAAAHAHLRHRIQRVCVFDIDLHHGNGTQSIAWQINEETYRKTLEDEANPFATGDGGLQIFYGSIHDILSYPCEDGNIAMVQAASTNLHGPHGQFIENIHLDSYTNDEHFWQVLYAQKYSKIFEQAQDFLSQTGGNADNTLILISCGFDACEHEYESMSRHGRRVPTSFYYRFARDACQFANAHASGRIISVLEGGYSDRALTSGAFAHLVGLAKVPAEHVDETWWSLSNLEELEQAIRKRRAPRKSGGGGRSTALLANSSTGPRSDTWITRTLEVLTAVNPGNAEPTAMTRKTLAPSTRVLRDRSGPTSPTPTKATVGTARKGRGHSKTYTGGSPRRRPLGKEDTQSAGASNPVPDGASLPEPNVHAADVLDGDEQRVMRDEDTSAKRIPRVVLKLGPRPQGPSS